jgi:hypothetical protein
MFNVFTVIDNSFSTTSVQIAGASNSVFPGGVVQYFGQSQLYLEAGQRITIMIQNGVSDMPVDALVFAWSLSLFRLSASKCPC